MVSTAEPDFVKKKKKMASAITEIKNDASMFKG